MTKEELLKYVSNPDVADECEQYYIDNGPDKHAQEGDDGGPGIEGVSCVEMNVDHMLGWMSGEASEVWDKLSTEDKKEVFNASHFQNGIMGFDSEDVDYYFKRHG